jgi:hypothetical protein
MDGRRQWGKLRLSQIKELVDFLVFFILCETLCNNYLNIKTTFHKEDIKLHKVTGVSLALSNDYNVFSIFLTIK